MMADSTKPRTCAEAEAQIEAEVNRAEDLGEILEAVKCVVTEAQEAADAAEGLVLLARERLARDHHEIGRCDLAALTAALVGMRGYLYGIRGSALLAAERARVAAKAAGYDEDVPF